MQLNKFEQDILNELIQERMGYRELANVDYSCYNNVNSDGAVEILQQDFLSVEDVKKTVGWACYLCDGNVVVEDPVKHLIECHMDLLIEKVHEYSHRYLDDSDWDGFF